MSFKGWKLLDKVDVAVKTKPGSYSFTGFIVDHGDKKALKKAKDWARESDYDYEKREYTATYEPEVYTFDNEGFTARILNSAGGSSQGGRLSFWRCEIEKEGVKFTIGVNDAILADLIKNSEIKNGLIAEKVMFARQGGQPGLIHEHMDAYNEAVADMNQKADLKKAKKTKDWEIGGVYSTLTQTDVCLGQVWDTLEEYEAEAPYSTYYSYGRKVTKYRKRNTPVQVTAWVSPYHSKGDVTNFTEMLKAELDSSYVHFSTGVPPARSKSKQLEVKDSDFEFLDKLLAARVEYGRYSTEGDKVKGRYVRKLKK